MSDLNSYTVILFPDFEKLQREIEKMRVELSLLVLERDELLYIECKNIEMAYMLTLGGLEYKAYEIQCAILRLKRKIELIQIKRNRQERIILSAIEAALDSEFEEYQKKLEEQIEKMNAAIERGKGTYLSEKENRELKKLYRTVVKELHPDLHPNLSEAQAQLFQNAVSAYENGDLNGLRIISAMVAEPVLPEKSESGMAGLMKEKERLSRLIKKLRDRIAEIKAEFPYTVKAVVQSPEMTAAKKEEIEEIIRQLNEVLTSYQEKVVEMLR